MKALLDEPDRHDVQGLRDYALLLFLYNTGARASEASRLMVEDLDLAVPMATLHGKGRRVRQCPLWKVTEMKAKALARCEAPLSINGTCSSHGNVKQVANKRGR